MTIAHTNPREEMMALEIQQLKTDRNYWRKLAEDYRREADTARDLLDKSRRIILEMDAKLLRGKA